MVQRLILNRDVTKEECRWLQRDYLKGEEVYRFTGYTYGCISPMGTACTESPNGEDTPFFELPTKALDAVLT